MPDRRWRDSALCAQVGPEPFFPEDINPNYTERNLRVDQDGYRRIERELKAPSVCDHCPVLRECFLFGLPEKHGYWGGTTPRQRREIRVLLGVAPRVEYEPCPDELEEEAA